MKFFRHDHGGGVVPADRPAAVLAPADEGPSASSEGELSSQALDASFPHGEATAPLACAPGGHGAAGDSAAGRHFQGLAEAPPPSPRPAAEAEEDGSIPKLGSSPKRALHLEHDAECPVANPDPHSRPRSRQFFRLGRHRSKAIDAPAPRGGADKVYASTSDSSDDELHNLRPKPAARRRLALRKPGLRRTMSLPVESPRPFEASSTDDDFNPRTPAIGAAGSADDALDPREGPADDRPVRSERPRRPRHRRTVTFACVQIREYSTILGDHPCCPSGPPLSLGWELQRENSVEFESYEQERLPARKASKEDIKLSDDARRGILQGLAAPAVDGAEEGSDSSDGEGGAGCPLYSSKELQRAERRLTRDRAGLNARAHRRAHRGFFKPLTAAERAAAAVGSPMKGLESTEASDDEPSEGEACCGGSCRMDISPAKPKDCAMENEAEA